jgi:Fe-S oxidoreductase
VLLSDKKCCGRPMISKGMLSQAKENAAWNVDKLAPLAQKGTPIVGLEPSCLLTLRDEYPDFIRTDAAKKVAENSSIVRERKGGDCR